MTVIRSLFSFGKDHRTNGYSIKSVMINAIAKIPISLSVNGPNLFGIGIYL